MERRVPGPADRLRKRHVSVSFPVPGGIEDPVVDGGPHEDALDHQQGQVIHPAAAQPDEGHGQVDAALDRQYQHQGHHQGAEGQGHDEEDRQGGQDRDAVQLPVKGPGHLLVHHGGTDEPGVPFQPVFAPLREGADEGPGFLGILRIHRVQDDAAVPLAFQLRRVLPDQVPRLSDLLPGGVVDKAG